MKIKVSIFPSYKSIEINERESIVEGKTIAQAVRHVLSANWKGKDWIIMGEIQNYLDKIPRYSVRISEKYDYIKVPARDSAAKHIFQSGEDKNLEILLERN